MNKNSKPVYKLLHQIFMKHYFLVLFLLCSFQGFSQDTSSFFNPTEKIGTVPQSPEVAAFSKVSSNISMYTGTPNISIPIYTFQGKEISVPVSLSYDASGIKVEQQSTTIGLGWNINAGGIVTRNVHGFVDDYIRQGQVGYKRIYEEVAKNFINSFSPMGTITGNTFNPNAARLLYNDFEDFLIDLQADTFSFNVNGLSGRIVIDYRDPINNSSSPLGFKAYVIDNPDMKAEAFYGGGSGESEHIERFEITDTKGTKYTFSAKETTEHHSSPAMTNGDDASNDEFTREYVTAWHLTSIESVNGIDTFTFSYSMNQWDEWGDVFDLEQVQFVYDVQNSQTTAQSSKKFGSDKYLKTQPILERISYRDYELVTTQVYDRDDIKGNTSESAIPRINKFELFQYSGANNPVQNSLLTVDLQQNYFYASTPNSTNYRDFRLKLNEVSFYREANSDPKKYVFGYESNNQIPPLDSNGMDFWGYYNGVDGNVTTIPNPNNNYDDIAGIPLGFLVGQEGDASANRIPDFANTKVASLTSITYPTGGTSTYEYEQHKDSDNQIVGGLRVRKVTNSTNDPVAGEDLTYTTYYLYDDINNLFTSTNLPSSENDLPPIYTSSGIVQQGINYFEIKIMEIENDVESNYFAYGTNRAPIVPNAITYSKVTELRFNTGSTANPFEGCTVTEFYNDKYENTGFIRDEVQPFYIENLHYGAIKNQWVFDSQIRLLQYINNEYETHVLDTITMAGLIMYPNGGTTGVDNSGVYGSGCFKITGEFNFAAISTNDDCPDDYIPYSDGYAGLKGYRRYDYVYGYTYNIAFSKLIKTITESYEGLQTLQQLTNYTYDSANHTFATKTETKDSKDRIVRQEITYPADANNSHPNYGTGGLLDAMVARNQTASPVEVVQSYQTAPSSNTYDAISKQRRIYDDFNTSQAEIYPSLVQVQKGTRPMEDRMVYHKYDSYGNAIEISYKDGMHHMYIWGYHGQQLIAELKNATFDNITAAAQTAIDDVIIDSNSEDSPTAEGLIRNDLKLLQSTHFPNAQISIYTHDPGIGVSSVTDVRGYTTFYYYDQHNRLDYATDQDGKVLSKNEYNLRIN